MCIKVPEVVCLDRNFIIKTPHKAITWKTRRQVERRGLYKMYQWERSVHNSTAILFQMKYVRAEAL
jgi:hypothetical protein